jgi:hypothetical protein
VSDYAGDEFYVDDDYGIDPEVLDEMQVWAEEAQAAGQAAFDERLDEFERQQAAEDEQLAAEAEYEDAVAADEQTLETLFIEAGQRHGIRSESEMTTAIAVANGLLSDPSFIDQHREPGIGQVKAAINRAMELVVPEDEGDEIETAVRVMNRRRAERNYYEGSEDPSAGETLLEAGAIAYGIPRQLINSLMRLPLEEKVEVARAIGFGQPRGPDGRFT